MIWSLLIRAYSICFVHAIVAHTRLPLFQSIFNFFTVLSRFSNILPFFALFLLFFWKTVHMPLLSRIFAADICMNLKTLLKSSFLAIIQPYKQQIIWNLSKWVVFLKNNCGFIFCGRSFCKNVKIPQKDISPATG